MEDSTPSPINLEIEPELPISPPMVHCKEIGVGTSGSLPKPEKTKRSKKIKQEKELSKREKERAVAEAIDQEILSVKKASLERPKSKAPQPPSTYFNDDDQKTIDMPTQVNTEERKKNFLRQRVQRK